MAVKLRKLNQRLGVSISAISLILSGRQERYVDKTRKAVLSAAKDLRYRSNPLSKALRTIRVNAHMLSLHEREKGLMTKSVTEIDLAARPALDSHSR